MSQKVRMSLAAAVIAMAAFLSLGGAYAVQARHGEDDTTSTETQAQTETETETEHGTTTTTTTATTTDSGSPEHQAAVKERVQGKLDDARKKVCTARVTAIKKIMANAATAGQRHMEVFDKILARVQEFYIKKKLSVANYDALVAAANAKKAAAATTIDAVKNNVNFDCNSGNPVATADAFNGKVKAMHQALKDYRTAITDVLKAVKQAASAAEGEAQQ
jgi:hypothetical protein